MCLHSIMLICVSIVVCVSVFSGCIENNDGVDFLANLYSFENDMQGWKQNGTDLDNPPINWSVERSSDRATDGNYSIKLFLSNLNDAGKIWMEKYFDVTPLALYSVNVSYRFATADFGDFNLFQLITTVCGDGFSGMDDLNYEGDTGHHLETEGFIWVDKSFDYIVEIDAQGQIYVNIGVWGTWETDRTYYVDEVNITIERVETLAAYPDVSGVWMVQHFNFMGNMTAEENVTVIQDNSSVEFQFQVDGSVQGWIVRNTISNPEFDTEFIIKGVDFRGLGINVIYIVNESSMITELPMCETCNPSVFSR